ncbi:hypothetical protein TWF718_009631 [Orbilia javanica]|uniref:Uncharacterized protein n=1 Tax=Orbilia javanica TaxID=47235 RepID=A0AAN8MQ43_9PEZI
MKLDLSLLFGVLAFGTVTSAAPVDDPSIGVSSSLSKQLEKKAAETSSAKPLDKRTIGGIYITTDVNWQGQKGYKVQPLNTCISLTAPWLYTISSFGPDKGTACVLYRLHSSGQAVETCETKTSTMRQDLGSAGK